MIYEIFKAIEDRIIASQTYASFNIFRFQSSGNSNQQSNLSVPYVKIAFDKEETRGDIQRWRLTSEVIYSVEIRWKTDYNDINSIERMQEKSLYARELKKAIFPSSQEENFLNLQCVLDMAFTIEPVEINSLEVKKHNGLLTEIRVEYAEQIK